MENEMEVLWYVLMEFWQWRHASRRVTTLQLRSKQKFLSNPEDKLKNKSQQQIKARMYNFYMISYLGCGVRARQSKP